MVENTLALAKVEKIHILTRDLPTLFGPFMADTPAPPPDAQSDAPAAPTTPPKRGPGHRGAEVKDTVAEMAAKAHEISLEAGSRMAAAMKDVVNAAAGISGFVLESTRDLVQYMVRRGQMTQEEADKLIRQAEEAQAGRPKVAPTPKATPVSAPQTSSSSEVEDDEPLEDEEDGDDSSSDSESKSAKATDKTAAKKAAAKSPAAKKSTAKKK